MWRVFKSESSVAESDASSANSQLCQECEEVERQRERALKLNARLKKRVEELRKRIKSPAEADVTEWDVRRCREVLTEQKGEFSRCLAQLRERGSERRLQEDAHWALKQKHKDERYCNAFLKEDLGRLEERLSRQRAREEKCRRKAEESRVLSGIIGKLRERRRHLRAEVQEQQRTLRKHRLQRDAAQAGRLLAEEAEALREDLRASRRWVALCGTARSDIAFFEDRSARFRGEIRELEERIRVAKGEGDGDRPGGEAEGGDAWLQTLQKELQAW